MSSFSGDYQTRDQIGIHWIPPAEWESLRQSLNAECKENSKTEWFCLQIGEVELTFFKNMSNEAA
ncbi:MAG: hypothetical protein WC332_00785 [Clostridia bacterium]|jgi:hypothetical protein